MAPKEDPSFWVRTSNTIDRANLSAMPKSIRDLLAGEPHPSELNEPSLRDLAENGPPEWSTKSDPHGEYHARMPGDGNHPMWDSSANPLPGVGVMELARRLRDGKLPPATERKARSYLDAYQKMTGDQVYAAGNHEPAFPTEQGYFCRGCGATTYGAPCQDCR